MVYFIDSKIYFYSLASLYQNKLSISTLDNGFLAQDNQQSLSIARLRNSILKLRWLPHDNGILFGLTSKSINIIDCENLEIISSFKIRNCLDFDVSDSFRNPLLVHLNEAGNQIKFTDIISGSPSVINFGTFDVKEIIFISGESYHVLFRE